MFKKKTKIYFVIIAAIILVLAVFGAYQVLMLRRAHSSFENYYAFRGCETLISRTDSDGICRTKSGQTIRIVKFEGRWFLDGDLPCGFLCF